MYIDVTMVVKMTRCDVPGIVQYLDDQTCQNVHDCICWKFIAIFYCIVCIVLLLMLYKVFINKIEICYGHRCLVTIEFSRAYRTLLINRLDPKGLMSDSISEKSIVLRNPFLTCNKWCEVPFLLDFPENGKIF